MDFSTNQVPMAVESILWFYFFLFPPVAHQVKEEMQTHFSSVKNIDACSMAIDSVLNCPNDSNSRGGQY